MITNYGREQLAVRIGSDIDIPGAMALGSGSGTATVSDVALVAEYNRRVITNVDMSQSQEIEFETDWSSIELSGTSLTEFGVFVSGALGTGSLWSRESFPAVTFDGTVELQVQVTYKVI